MGSIHSQLPVNDEPQPSSLDSFRSVISDETEFTAFEAKALRLHSSRPQLNTFESGCVVLGTDPQFHDSRVHMLCSCQQQCEEGEVVSQPLLSYIEVWSELLSQCPVKVVLTGELRSTYQSCKERYGTAEKDKIFQILGCERVFPIEDVHVSTTGVVVTHTLVMDISRISSGPEEILLIPHGIRMCFQRFTKSYCVLEMAQHEPRTEKYFSLRTLPTAHRLCISGCDWNIVGATRDVRGDAQEISAQFLYNFPIGEHDNFTLAHTAAAYGNVSVLRGLLEEDPELSKASTSGGISVMHMAALGGNMQCIQMLLNLGSSIVSMSESGVSVMQCAAYSGCVSCIRYVMEMGGSVHDRTRTGWTVTMSAATSANVKALEYVLSHGGSIRDRRPDGWTVVMAAARGGGIECLKYLAAQGANMHQVSEGGYSPMWAAAASGSIECVEYLRNIGADVNVLSLTGNTALEVASSSGHVGCVKYLLLCRAHVSHDPSAPLLALTEFMKG